MVAVMTKRPPVRELDQAPAPAVFRGVLILHTPTGTEHLAWRTDDKRSVALAQQAFDNYRAQGFRTYSMSLTTEAPTKNAGSHVAEEITHFDPQAREIVGIMPLRGGV